jgi:hypothetical protein
MIAVPGHESKYSDFHFFIGRSGPVVIIGVTFVRGGECVLRQ